MKCQPFETAISISQGGRKSNQAEAVRTPATKRPNSILGPAGFASLSSTKRLPEKQRTPVSAWWRTAQPHFTADFHPPPTQRGLPLGRVNTSISPRHLLRRTAL